MYAQNFGSRQRSRFLALIKRNAVLAFRDELRKKSSQYSRHYDILTSNMRMRKRSLSSLVCFRARGSCYLAPRNRDWEKSEGELTSQRLIALRMFLRWFQYSSILTPSAARFKMSFADNATRLWEREWNRSPKEGLKNRDSQGFISFHFQFKYFIFFFLLHRGEESRRHTVKHNTQQPANSETSSTASLVHHDRLSCF